ncbi:patatin-like phospholipase family protein [Kitasatospora arboriphila]
MYAPDRALVLGAGGPVGTAWTAGFARGLRRSGVDLGAADLIVGTSAGAITAALLATGQDPGRLATPVRPDDAGSTLPGWTDAGSARPSPCSALPPRTRPARGAGSAGSRSRPKPAPSRHTSTGCAPWSARTDGRTGDC